MSANLFQYHEIYPTTWAYVSSLMIIGLFFKFSRFWSVRNLDLMLLILLSPGLLLIHFGQDVQKNAQQMAAVQTGDDTLIESWVGVGSELDVAESSLESDGRSQGEPDGDTKEGPNGPHESSLVDESSVDGSVSSADLDASAEDAAVTELARSTPSSRAGLRGESVERIGYIWVFVAGVFILVRLLIDTAMVRRPLLDPNLTLGGLTFVCCSLFVFLTANVITGEPTEDDLKGPRGAERLWAGDEADQSEDSLGRYGPGLPLLHLLPTLSTVWGHSADNAPVAEQEQTRYVYAAKLMAILSQLAIVIGVVVIGCRHFENIRAGMGAAVLYLLLPYTSMMTGRVMHVLPAALLVWAVVFYRRPEVAGGFLGFAMGVVYYPFFLLPLWISFYWQRGLARFAAGVVLSLTLVVLSLVFTTSDMADFWEHVRRIFGIMIPRTQGLEGFWQSLDEAYRVYRFPVLAAFIGISLAMTLWPAQKNLGTLISCSATVMLATQYWMGYGGGLSMAWYMPLVLLTIFRPNLEDRVALAVLGDFWPGRRLRTDRTAGRAVTPSK